MKGLAGMCRAVQRLCSICAAAMQQLCVRGCAEVAVGRRLCSSVVAAAVQKLFGGYGGAVRWLRGSYLSAIYRMCRAVRHLCSSCVAAAVQ